MSELERLERIEALNEKRSELMRDLRRSIALAELVPGVFGNGGAFIAARGNPYSGINIRVIDGGGVVRHECDLADFPVDLWPRDVRAHVMEVGRGKYYRRLDGCKKATKAFIDRRRAAGLPITREALRREFPELSWREINQLFDEVQS